MASTTAKQAQSTSPTTSAQSDARASESSSLLEIRGLTLEMDGHGGSVRVLEDVSLTVGFGETVCLVGESGSGKSLTALSIARLIPSPPARYAGGEIRFEGRDVLGMTNAALRRIRGGKVGYIFQEPGASLNPVIPVGRQIMESLKLHRPEAATDEEVTRWLREVGIPAPEERRRAYPHEMSGGMQQRVMIAMALAAGPALLVADEPTTALDVTIQAQIMELLASLRRRGNMSLLLITHNLGLVGDVADRVAVMYAGQIVEWASAKQLLSRPLHPYTQALLDAVPKMNSERERLPALPGTVPRPGNWPSGCRFHPRCPKARPSCASETPAYAEASAGHWVRCPFLD